MFLSRLILNPSSRRVQREIAEAYQMHRSLMRAFPEDLAAREERVLFRLDAEPRGGNVVLLVQSWALPDWSWLAAPGEHGYLLPVSEPNPAVKAFELQLAPGQVLAFRLRANPTVKRKVEGGSPARLGLLREQDQLDWLRRKGEQGGFRLLSASATGNEFVKGIIRKDGQEHGLSLLAVQFDGVLQVVDPDRLCETVRRGVGSGKGLGFGLLSLARPQ